MPEDTRAELIEGQIYYHAAPGRIHQEILAELTTIILQYIKSKVIFWAHQHLSPYILKETNVFLEHRGFMCHCVANPHAHKITLNHHF